MDRKRAGMTEDFQGFLENRYDRELNQIPGAGEMVIRGIIAFAEENENIPGEIGFLTLRRLLNEIVNSHNQYADITIDPEDGLFSDTPLEGRSIEDLKKHMRNVLVADNVLLFFTLSTEILNQLCIKTLEEAIIIEDYQETRKTGDLLDGIGQPVRERLLKRCGVLDHTVVDEINRTRSFRNDLVHDLDERYFMESTDDVLEEVENCLSAINGLYQYHFGFDAFYIEDE